MKVPNLVKTDNYQLLLNKKFFLEQNSEKGSLNSKRFFYLSYKVYLKMLELFEEMDKTNDKKELVKLIQKVENCENRLQKMWGFTTNSIYHRYWSHAHSCKCNSIKNYDYSYERIYSPECKIHNHLIP